MLFQSFIKRASTLRIDRRGSVLILCVVLIVVLALMGTALLSTARIDRFTAAQNASNTQIEMLVEGAKQIAKSAITNDLYDTSAPAPAPPKYRTPTESHVDVTTDPVTFDPWDGYTIIPMGTPVPAQNDTWMASPVPKIVLDYSGGIGVTPVPESAPYWDTITGALIGGTFENPMDGAPTTPVTEHTHMVPTVHMISGKTYPAMLHIETGGTLELPDGSAPSVTRSWLAGDADGDGIADSLYQRMVELNGVTYYIAVRIVDNAAKVNLNTARSSTADYDFSGARVDMHGTTPLGLGSFAANLGAFKAHVGAMEMFRRDDTTLAAHDPINVSPQAEMHLMNEDRFGFARGTPIVTAGVDPVDDTGTTRTDFDFVNEGDAMEHGLGQRLENPTINSATPPPTPAPYRAYGLADAAALAYHNGLTNTGASYSRLEQAFFDAYQFGGSINDPDSLVRSAPNYPGLQGAFPATGKGAFDPTNVGAWFDSMFNYDRAVGSFTVAGLVPDPFTNELRLDTAGVPPPAYEPYFRSLRPLVTTWNPISQQIATRLADLSGTPGLPPGMTPYRPTPPKTCVNTADFEELWRAYWCVMAEGTDSETPFDDATTPITDPVITPSLFAGMNFADTDQTTTPSDPTNEQHPARMFRNTIRDPRTVGPGICYMDYEQVVRMRAAMAAANTVAMRQNPAPMPVPEQDIGAVATINGTAGTGVNIRIYPMQPQPFLTEVYVNTSDRQDPTIPNPPNPNGYIAIELYNPYPIPMDLNECQIIAIDRTATGTFPLVLTLVATLDTQAIVPPNGYLLLENHTGPGGPGAVYRPPSSRLPLDGSIPARNPTDPPLNVVVVPNLHQILNHEMLIQTGLPAADLDHPDHRPIESFDLTGIEVDSAGGRAVVLHYARGTGPGSQWRWIYPGRYFGDYDVRRQQGMQLASFLPDAGEPDPWVNAPTIPTNVVVTLGAALAGATPNTNDTATYDNTFPIQWATADLAGPNPATGAMNHFPFGGFARDGDILQVPFIAAHRIYRSTGPGSYETIEINTLSMDAAFAEDTDINTDPPLAVGDPGTRAREQIGRFCPINLTDDPLVAGTADDYDNDPDLHRYAWAKDLFDYLTVEAPSLDFLPNVNPDPTALPPYPGTPPPEPVRNSGLPASTFATPGSEDTLPVHGRININTAPWPVLAAIPWVQGSNPPAVPDLYGYDDATGIFTGPPAPPNGRDDNIDIARAIVAWRDGNPAGGTVAANAPNGPFRSVFDLYRVVDRSAAPGVNIFRAIQQSLMPAAPGDIDDDQGDFSPFGTPLTDGVRYDHEDQYLLLNRVSNLITTRSDSYTVYILLQGWRGVGTTAPEVVVQRRVAFILDRSPVTSQSNQPNTIKVVND